LDDSRLEAAVLGHGAGTTTSVKRLIARVLYCYVTGCGFHLQLVIAPRRPTNPILESRKPSDTACVIAVAFCLFSGENILRQQRGSLKYCISSSSYSDCELLPSLGYLYATQRNSPATNILATQLITVKKHQDDLRRLR
jgi:hypothetical protein